MDHRDKTALKAQRGSQEQGVYLGQGGCLDRREMKGHQDHQGPQAWRADLVEKDFLGALALKVQRVNPVLLERLENLVNGA